MTIKCEMKMESTDFSIPDTIQPLFEQLQEALLLEIKFKPNLQLPSETQNDEITMGARNGSAHVLRCLKVWYDLPSEVFFIAINLMDRFLTKMKARPKYMECISVSSFYIAATQVIEQSLNADHLVSISQCKCTGSDLNRMSEVIRNKLEWAPGTQPITSFTFLKLFNDIFYKIASHLNFGDLYNNLIMKSELFLRLEMVACDGGCASYKPSEIALVLLFSYLNSAIKQLNTKNDSSNSANQMLRLIKFITEMQKICQITDVTFLTCQESVEAVLSKYNAQEQTPHRQRLIWKLSSRTARLLRPTDKFTSVLPVIAENTTVPSSKRMRKNRKFTKIKETFFLHNG